MAHGFSLLPLFMVEVVFSFLTHTCDLNLWCSLKTEFALALQVRYSNILSMTLFYIVLGLCGARQLGKYEKVHGVKQFPMVRDYFYRVNPTITGTTSIVLTVSHT